MSEASETSTPVEDATESEPELEAPEAAESRPEVVSAENPDEESLRVAGAPRTQDRGRDRGVGCARRWRPVRTSPPPPLIDRGHIRSGFPRRISR